MAGNIIFVEEIVPCYSNFFNNKYLIVVGKVLEYKVEENKILLGSCLRDKSHILIIDTSLIDTCNIHENSLYQFFGELQEKTKNINTYLAKAYRCIDGMDMTLYKKAIDIQRVHIYKNCRNKETTQKKFVYVLNSYVIALILPTVIKKLKGPLDRYLREVITIATISNGFDLTFFGGDAKFQIKDLPKDLKLSHLFSGSSDDELEGYRMFGILDFGGPSNLELKE